MIRFLSATVPAIVALLISLSGPVAAQERKDVLRATHGEWEIRCIEGTETCVMSQVGKTADGKRALLVTVQRLKDRKTEDGKPIPAAITAQTPLGILIPYGLRLKIDDGPVIPLPLSRCIPAGCVSQAPMLDEAVSRMKKGTTAVFGFFLQSEILVNVSLNGFTKAYNNLKPVSAEAN